MLAHIVECVSEYIILFFSKNTIKQKNNQTKSKKTKEKRKISVENKTGYNDTLCEYHFNEIFPGCSYEFKN